MQKITIIAWSLNQYSRQKLVDIWLIVAYSHAQHFLNYMYMKTISFIKGY